MRVLVTGAGRAIGRATVQALVARGHEAVATARDPARLADLGPAMCLALDVTDGASVARALAQAGELDAIVNNAALSVAGPLEAMPLDDLALVLDTNVVGALRVVQPVLPAWRERGSGVIVNVSSVQGRVATPLGGPYAASKFALEGLSETLYVELGHFGIRVVLVEPGYTAPGMQEAKTHPGPAAYDSLREQWRNARNALGGLSGSDGLPGPETVAAAIVDAIEDLETPLRVTCGTDAEAVLAARRSMDDDAFEAAMREVLGLTW